MAVLLTKIVNGRTIEIDTLPNQQTIKCPRCEQTYRFGYSDDEWNKISAWLAKAERAMRESHKTGHEAAKLELRW
jgi:spore germination protein YaaH